MMSRLTLSAAIVLISAIYVASADFTQDGE